MLEKPSAYEEVLTQARAEHKKLSNRLERVKGFIEYLEEYLGMGETSPEQMPTETTVPESERFKNVSSAVAAHMILREHGKPMLLRRIAKEMQKAGYQGIKPTKDWRKIYQALYTMMKRHADRFEKISAGKFGLVEWKKQTE